MNFYTWVREGVKRAILLGFADAIEQIGVPHENDDAGQQLLAVLRQGKTLEAPERAPAATTGRKRLGRSLDEIVKNPAPAAS
ncbi:MAG: hypothetical protein K1X71_10795 [Pirellulales bacterium]|jgi:hypothetical protein|nr:hypothetical protein [Pirellulales bacterium]